jgi:hypothetical protein
MAYASKLVCYVTDAGSFTGVVEAHNVLALRFTPLAKSKQLEKWRPWQWRLASSGGQSRLNLVES